MVNLAVQLVEVAGSAWWVWVVVTTAAGLIAWGIRVVVKLIVQPLQFVQSGHMIPSSTVDQIVASKDAQLARLEVEIVRIWEALEIERAAYRDLAQSIEENTDAIQLMTRNGGSSRSGPSSEATNARRRGAGER